MNRITVTKQVCEAQIYLTSSGKTSLILKRLLAHVCFRPSFCFCLCQNGGESKLSYHPCFSANTINNWALFPPQIVSILEPHVPVENMPYLSLQLPVLTNNTQKRMGHNRPFSLNFSALSFSLSILFDIFDQRTNTVAVLHKT